MVIFPRFFVAANNLAHGLVERILPDVAIRQYVLSPPSELVGLLGARSEPLSALARIFVRAVFAAIERRVDSDTRAHCGAVIVVQRFSKTIALFPHLHVLALDGAYVEGGDDVLEFRVDSGPTTGHLRDLRTSPAREASRPLPLPGARHRSRTSR